MRLYIYDHCPFCARARMIFGLRDVPVEVQTMLFDDGETPTRLVGQKDAPILEFDEGGTLSDTQQIVRGIDDQAEGVKVMEGPQNPEIERWVKAASPTIFKLFAPRVVEAPLGELATPEAASQFHAHMTNMVGDLESLKEQTAPLLVELERWLNELEPLIQSPEAVNQVLSLDDITLYPVLRHLSLVEGVKYPPKVDAYRRAMAQLSRVPLHDQPIDPS
ncbi:glutaredoxin 2 [Salinicola avicenniae]|uniref:glutaredoxin 2 n=1 Tax=Salinicola avicenniae TaxID=2916836 RepID=UPI00207471A9|nr:MULTISPECIES: glutaredoxin 2 [unclassified Salinicola]